MPTSDDRERWLGWGERARSIGEAARSDPYDPKLAEAMQALAKEFDARVVEADDAVARAADDRQTIAAAHANIAEAWFALYRSLKAFDAALRLLGNANTSVPSWAAAAAQARCGRGKRLVSLERPAEASAELEASIQWYTTQSDSTNDEQQSLLSQALHTLGMAHADVGDHERALAQPRPPSKSAVG